MAYINALLEELKSRLPELEWKLSDFKTAISRSSLPIGLFRTRVELTGTACINEIKKDIQFLSQQENERSAHYLASKIHQKINVLVTLCQMTRQASKSENKVLFAVKKLSSRQQWVQSLEHDVNTLRAQQQALIKTLELKQQTSDTEAELHLLKELGEVERRLTLAKETLTRAVF
jgi:hypothetical protein